MTIELTYEQAKKDLLEIAEANPDFIYEEGERGCVYFDDQGQPSCIVGQVLSKHGLKKSDLVRYEEYDDGSGHERDYNHSAAINTLNTEGFIDVDSKTKSLLSFAQNFQDNRAKWSQAVSRAIDQVENN